MYYLSAKKNEWYINITKQTKHFYPNVLFMNLEIVIAFTIAIGPNLDVNIQGQVTENGT